MLKPKNDLLQGTLVLLVLKTLASRPLARLRHDPSHPDGFKGHPARRGRLSLSPRSHRMETGRVGRRGMGHLREQSPRPATIG